MVWYNLTKNEELPNDPAGLQKLWGASKTLEKVEKMQLMGFHLPVCDNPGGEAISNVGTGEGRNYPCVKSFPTIRRKMLTCAADVCVATSRGQ